MAVAGSLAWGETTATVYVGQTITVPITSDSSKNEVPGFGPTAVADIVSASGTELQIIGQSEGTLNIPAGTTWIEEYPAMDMSTTNSFTLTILPDEPKVAKQSQWEDLANRIKERAEIRTLTTADYDWPTTGTRSGIALWKLPSGMYISGGENINVYTEADNLVTIISSTGGFALVKQWTNDTTGGATVFVYNGTQLVGSGNVLASGTHGTQYMDEEFRFDISQMGNGKVNSGTSGDHPFAMYIGRDDDDQFWTSVYNKTGSGPTLLQYSYDTEGYAEWDETRLAKYSEVPIITMQTTDPGEGVALAANNFIAVYNA